MWLTRMNIVIAVVGATVSTKRQRREAIPIIRHSGGSRESDNDISCSIYL